MSEPLLDVRELVVTFGGLTAIDHVSISIPQGEIRGLIGPNGAGKTTFFNAISGVVESSEGEIVFAGEPITNMPPHQRAACGIRRTFQHVQLMEDRTVLENVLVGMHLDFSLNPFKTIFALGGKRAPDRRARDKAREVMTFLGIEDLMLREVGGLTIAEHRFIELARALVAEPKLLMLDEPAAGLSIASIEALDEQFDRIRQAWGTTIFLVEHVVSLVLNVCDRITVLDNGRVIADGSGEEVVSDPTVQQAYMGVEEV